MVVGIHIDRSFQSFIPISKMPEMANMIFSPNITLPPLACVGPAVDWWSNYSSGKWGNVTHQLRGDWWIAILLACITRKSKHNNDSSDSSATTKYYCHLITCPPCHPDSTLQNVENITLLHLFSVFSCTEL